MGLVLVADTSSDAASDEQATAQQSQSQSQSHSQSQSQQRRYGFRMLDGVNGVLRGEGVLRFNDSVDM